MNFGKQAVTNASSIEPGLPKLQASGVTTQQPTVTPKARPVTGVPTATGGKRQPSGKQTKLHAVAKQKTRKKAFAGTS